MQQTTPKVFMVAETRLIDEGMDSFLAEIGHPDWESNDGITEPEQLIEAMGRGCYRSWKVGDNANVTKVRESSREYLQNIQKQQHGAVCEHASVSFMFVNVSRVFTHELVRHRAGVAISQESLRYVRLTDLEYWLPKVLRDKDGFAEEAAEVVQFLEYKQKLWAQLFELDKEGTPFGMKKLVTSALRRFAPIGLSTRIGWTANFRALPNIIDLRTSPHAEEEIRVVFGEVARQLQQRHPTFFRWEVDMGDDGLCHYKLPTGKL